MNNLILLFYYLIQSAGLYLIHLVMVRRLRINALDVRFEIVGNKPRTVIYWEVQGCHRIDVNAYPRRLPGSVKGISLKFNEKGQSVTIQFRGVFNKIERIVDIQEYVEMSQFFTAPPLTFSTCLYPGRLEPEISGLPILTENYERTKLLSDFAAQGLSNTFSETAISTHISPSPAVFLKISQKEQIYFQ